MTLYTVIVTYNAARWIERNIRSLREGTLKPQIVVVDNGSTDATIALIQQFPDVVLIQNQQNVGFGKANNIGMRHALQNQADHIFLLNQDAYVFPDALAHLVDVATHHPDVGILSPIHLNGDVTQVDPRFLTYLNFDPVRRYLSDLASGNPIDALYNSTYFNAAAWLLPRQMLLKIGGFDPLYFMYGEDDDLCNRVLRHQYKIGLVPAAKIAHYRENSGRPLTWRQKLYIKTNAQYAILLTRVKDIRYGFVKGLLRASALFVSEFGRSVFSGYGMKSLAMLLGAGWILARFPKILKHRRQTLTFGAHWLEIDSSP